MKIPYLFSLFILFPLITFAQTSERKLPSVDIKTIAGNIFNTNQISNDHKPIIICVWETFCKPCINELDAIAENYDDWKSETGIKLIAISIDSPRTSANVARLVNAKNWEYDVYIDVNQDFKRTMSVPFCPYTYLIDGNGNIVWEKGAYAEGDLDELYNMILKLKEEEK